MTTWHPGLFSGHLARCSGPQKGLQSGIDIEQTSLPGERSVAIIRYWRCEIYGGELRNEVIRVALLSCPGSGHWVMAAPGSHHLLISAYFFRCSCFIASLREFLNPSSSTAFISNSVS